MSAQHNIRIWRRLCNPFDLVVLAGGAVNLLVVGYLVGYWLLHG